MSLASESACVNLDSCAVVERLEAHESGEEALCADNNAVVFEHYGVYAALEFSCDIVAQRLASRESVLCHGNLAAEHFRIRNERCIGNLTHYAEGYERRRMCMKHCTQVGALLVDGTVERIFHRGAVNTDYSSVGLYLHDILAAEVALVYAAGADPDCAVGIAD